MKTDKKRLAIPTEAELKAAKRLAGRSWFSLSSDETRLAIICQRVYGILGRALNGQVGPYIGFKAEYS